MTFRQSDLRKYSIESGIPIAPGIAQKRIYPFNAMNVGDSFPLVDSSVHEIDRVRAAVQGFQRYHSPMKFAVRRTQPSGPYRCWRIA